MASPPCLKPHSSTSSSSECSSVVTSTKRARSPRKRPNQSYTEAAVLLSKVYPNVFTTNTFPRHRYAPLSFCSVSPPPPPLLAAGAYLIEDDPSRSRSPSPASVSCRSDPKPAPCPQLLCAAGFEEQGSPPDYDVECILDEEVGIDGIMGKLSTVSNVSGVFAPLFGGLVGFGTGGQSSISNIRQALRCAHSGEWWRSSTMVEVKDIVPELDVLPKKTKTTSKKKKKKKSKVKKKKKKVVAVVVKELEGKLKSGLGLKLDYEGVVDAWSDRQFPFAKGAGVPEFSADDLARLAETDLTPDAEGGGAREGSVQRFREKRKTRLFSKKIRYQVRKVNADCRPRMKASGRFAKRSSPHQDAKEGS